MRPLVLLGAAVLVFAACRPVAVPPPPAPAPPPPPAVQTCADTNETPTPANPVEYVAVVDPTGPATPSVETFVVTSEADKDAKVAQLDTQGDVLAVDENTPVHALAVDPNTDPRYFTPPSTTGPQKAAIDQMGFPTAWASAGSPDGTGTTIAVIDTGVQAGHPDLNGKVVLGLDFYFGQPVHFHGTHVAGIAGQIDNAQGGIGGAPGSKILSARVLNSSGSGFSGDVASAIYDIVDNSDPNRRANVINLSLGGGPNASLQVAIQHAVANNVVVVAAAGNANSCNSSYPAAYPEAIAVGALTTGTNNKAPFSNFGSYVDVAAPGTTIDSTIPTSSYGTASGTSMATPFVAATAALVKSKCPAYTAAQVRNRIESNAVDVGQQLGFGRVRAYEAVTAPC